MYNGTRQACTWKPPGLELMKPKARAKVCKMDTMRAYLELLEAVYDTQGTIGWVMRRICRVELTSGSRRKRRPIINSNIVRTRLIRRRRCLFEAHQLLRTRCTATSALSARSTLHEPHRRARRPAPSCRRSPDGSSPARSGKASTGMLRFTTVEGDSTDFAAVCRAVVSILRAQVSLAPEDKR